MTGGKLTRRALIEAIVPFKRDVYAKVIQSFRTHLA